MTVSAVLGTGILAAGLVAAPMASASAGSATTAGSAATNNEGCAANGLRVPRGAHRADAGDIDGDGENDQVWVSNDRKGFRTASGAVYSQHIFNAGGPDAGVSAVHLKDDVVALVENGRLTFVTAFVDCKLVETYTADGENLSFARDFMSPYRDLGCRADDDYTDLVALTLGHKRTGKKHWLVKQNVVRITDDGTGASYGKTKVKAYTTKGKAKKALNALAAPNTCSTESA